MDSTPFDLEIIKSICKKKRIIIIKLRTAREHFSK